MKTQIHTALLLLVVAVGILVTLGVTWQAAEYTTHLKETNPEAAQALLVGLVIGFGAGFPFFKKR